MRLFPVILIGAALIIIGIGVYLAISQHRRTSLAQPVEAQILSSAVEVDTSIVKSPAQRDRTIEHHRPAIRYRYRVDGQWYESTQVTPIKVSGSNRARAQRIVDQFPAGSTRTVYYDRRDPQRSFVLRESSFLPYGLILLGMIPLCIGVVAATTTDRRKDNENAPVPRPTHNPDHRATRPIHDDDREADDR